MKKVLMAALVASAVCVSPAMAKSDNGKGNGQGCVSGGATADNPGQWLQALREHALLQGLTPAEIAELENTTPGWAGYGQTPTVGALLAFFCGN
jgi:hypothetical protein